MALEISLFITQGEHTFIENWVESLDFHKEFEDAYWVPQDVDTIFGCFHLILR